ncbi:hypothetical protein B0H21DRAFT_408525 [Amylocystis lapponica]|nr:hypothetical protein B0H21DRAFT_408525 [Amylocystis lapponica]
MTTLFSHSLTVIFDASHVHTLFSSSATCPRWAGRVLPDHTPYDKRYTSCAPNLRKKEGTRIYHAILQTYNGPRGGRNGAPVEVALKWVTGRDEVNALKWEAGFYENDLKLLQGTVVPHFYGMFQANINGVDVGCLALEWCGGTPTRDPTEFHRQKCIAASRMHDAGVFHGCLQNDRHFVVSRDGTPRIVDFSDASIHACQDRSFALRPHQEKPRSCKELIMLEKAFMQQPLAQDHWSRRMTTLFSGCRSINPGDSFFMN